MSFATITCIGFLVFFQCEEKKKAEPEPQRIVCSFDRVPKLSPDEKKGIPQKLRRYMLENENKLNKGNCPKKEK